MGNPGAAPYPDNLPPSGPGFQAGFVAPPPAYGAPPGPGAPVAPIITVVTAPQLGGGPTCTVCPYCSANITTDVEFQSGAKTHIMALLLCLVCPLGCCLIPYCTNSCMTASHTCPNCKKFLGNNTH